MPDLFIGGRYVQEGGRSSRLIEEIHGDDVCWRDEFAPGRCSKQSFYRWLGKGDLAPDSPPPPKPSPKGAKPITEDAIERVRNDVATLHKFGELTIEPCIMDSSGVMAEFLWALRSSVKRTEKEAQDLPGHIRKRVFTRIDVNAKIVQQSLISICEILNCFSAIDSGDQARLLLQVLSEGLESANRLRADVAPYLSQ
jgi:hypothetical protein